MENAMAYTVRFSVSKFDGKWIAQMMRSRKVEGYGFGTFGIDAINLGRFDSKEQALEAVAKKKATLSQQVSAGR